MFGQSKSMKHRNFIRQMYNDLDCPSSDMVYSCITWIKEGKTN